MDRLVTDPVRDDPGSGEDLSDELGLHESPSSGVRGDPKGKESTRVASRLKSLYASEESKSRDSGVSLDGICARSRVPQTVGLEFPIARHSRAKVGPKGQSREDIVVLASKTGQ